MLTTTTTTANAIDRLLYVNYKTNRNLRPDISLESWGKIYGDDKVKLMERKLIDEWLCELYDNMGDRNPLWSSEGNF